MSGPRDLVKTYPSASEIDAWDTCQFLWLMRWRRGIERIEPPIHLLNGRAVSDSMEAFYLAHGNPIDAYVKSVKKMVEAGELIENDAWAELEASTMSVLKLYYDTRRRDFFGEVLGCQVRFDTPVPGRIDLLAKNPATGRVRIVDQKLVSPFVDIEYENMKYNIGIQPGIYFADAVAAGHDVESFVVDYLMRSAPARGRYKALEATLPVPHEIPYQPWLADMALATAATAKSDMEAMMSWVSDDTAVYHIPRRTKNCLVKFGSKTFPCPFYQACSVCVHPLEVRDVYRELHPVEKEVVK